MLLSNEHASVMLDTLADLARELAGVVRKQDVDPLDLARLVVTVGDCRDFLNQVDSDLAAKR